MIKIEKGLDNCKTIKIILMIFVILYHSMFIYSTNSSSSVALTTSSRPLGLIAEFLSSFHIYSFTLISGYIFYYIKFEKNGYQRYGEFLLNKTKRLIVPYLFICLFWVVPTHIYLFGGNDIVNKFVLGISPIQLWFLLMLFWVFAIFYLISNFVNNKPFVGFIIVCVFYALAVLCGRFSNLFNIFTAFKYLFFFYIGFIIRKYNFGFLQKIPSVVYILLHGLLFFISIKFNKDDNVINKMIRIAIDFLLTCVGSVSAFMVLQRLAERFLSKSKLLNFLAPYSMTIYLVHQQPIYFIQVWYGNRVAPFILVVICFVISMVISTLIAFLMSKTKITRFLIGEKSKL